MQISADGFWIRRKSNSEVVPWEDFEYFRIVNTRYLNFASLQHAKESGRKRHLLSTIIPFSKDLTAESMVSILENCRIHFTEIQRFQENFFAHNNIGELLSFEYKKENFRVVKTIEYNK